MSDVDHLKEQIAGLSAQSLAKFRPWFIEFDVRAWHRQIDSDLDVGKLDALIAEGQADLKAGNNDEQVP